MEKFEKMFRTEIKHDIGLPIKYHYFLNNNLDYFYNFEIVDNNKINIFFEGKSISQYFQTKKERDDFMKFFKNKVREANTFGKN